MDRLRFTPDGPIETDGTKSDQTVAALPHSTGKIFTYLPPILRDGFPRGASTTLPRSYFEVRFRKQKSR